MTLQLPDETVNRFALATAELLRRGLDQEFADDAASVVFIAGPPLDAAKTDHWTLSAKETAMDVVYLTFEPGRERFGPSGVSIFAERWGAVFRWPDCVLWAPKDVGPLLVMPKGLNVCFAHDGKALISLPTRPTHALADGIARARKRLLLAARLVTEEQLRGVEYQWRMAA